MTKLDELLKQIEEEEWSEGIGLTQTEQDFIDLMQTLYINDFEAYKKYYYRFTAIRNKKIGEQ